MSDIPALTKELVMPEDFDVRAYESIHSHVSHKREAYHASWVEFSCAWTAVAYRFLSCTEHGRIFTESVQRAGKAPHQLERYIQESALFGFFVTGLATIESLCYGLFAIGSILCPERFSIRTVEDKKRATPENTRKHFAEVYPNEYITGALGRMVDAGGYRNWKDTRNILCHRISPPRHFYLGGPRNDQAIWMEDIQIDGKTTESKRQWLAKTISDILNAADTFTALNFSWYAAGYHPQR